MGETGAGVGYTFGEPGVPGEALHTRGGEPRPVHATTGDTGPTAGTRAAARKQQRPRSLPDNPVLLGQGSVLLETCGNVW